jgi:hypothetical protein
MACRQSFVDPTTASAGMTGPTSRTTAIPPDEITGLILPYFPLPCS